MSYKSIHATKSYGLKGGMFIVPVTVDVAFLRKIKWKDLCGWHPYLTGNTKFQELAIMMAFLKYCLCGCLAAAFVGYSINEKSGGTEAFFNRVARNCTSSYFELYEMMVKAGKLKKGYITKILTKPLSRRRISSEGRRIGKGLCKEAVKKYGSQARAARALHVDRSILSFWLNYDF